MAELLSPCSAIPIGLQPFRFIAMDETDLKTLRIAMASSEVGNDQISSFARTLGEQSDCKLQ